MELSDLSCPEEFCEVFTELRIKHNANILWISTQIRLAIAVIYKWGDCGIAPRRLPRKLQQVTRLLHELRVHPDSEDYVRLIRSYACDTLKKHGFGNDQKQTG